MPPEESRASKYDHVAPLPPSAAAQAVSQRAEDEKALVSAVASGNTVTFGVSHVSRPGPLAGSGAAGQGGGMSASEVMALKKAGIVGVARPFIRPESGGGVSPTNPSTNVPPLGGPGGMCGGIPGQQTKYDF